MSRSIPNVDAILTSALRTGAAATVGVLILVLLFVAQGAWPVLHEVGVARFATDPSWHPAEGTFGLMPMLMGSLTTSIGALLLAMPAGIAVALYCEFYAPSRISALYRKAIGVFAGIPSVVYGFWGLTVVVPWIADRHPPGASLAAGIFILALMIFPTVALTSHAALTQVPRSYLHGARALGMAETAVVFKIGLHAARAGVLSGGVLALARALGETMAVLMVSGNIVQMPTSVFDPVRTLAANVALEMAYALPLHRSALYASGAVLVLFVMALMLLSQRITKEVNDA